MGSRKEAVRPHIFQRPCGLHMHPSRSLRLLIESGGSRRPPSLQFLCIFFFYCYNVIQYHMPVNQTQYRGCRLHPLCKEQRAEESGLWKGLVEGTTSRKQGRGTNSICFLTPRVGIGGSQQLLRLHLLPFRISRTLVLATRDLNPLSTSGKLIIFLSLGG